MEDIRYPDEKRTGTKIAKVLFFGCGGCLLLSALLALILVLVGFWAAKQTFITDPVKVKEMAHSIMDFELPGEEKGAFAMSVGFKMAVVHNGDDLTESQSMIVLASFPTSWTGAQEESIEQKIHSIMEEKEETVIEETEVREGILCGKEVSIIISEGWAERGSGRIPLTLFQVFFTHEDDSIFVLAFGFGEDHRKTAEDLFNSLQCIE